MFYQAEAARQAKLENLFPGLSQLQNAAEDEERYADQFARMMDDEGNDGARPPKPIKVRYADLAQKFPQAASYLEAQRLATGSHWASGRGPVYDRAVARMEAGEDTATVLVEAEKEWSEIALRACMNS